MRLTEEQRAAVAAEARSWVRTPYHSNARVKGVGVDCGQILCAVYEAAGAVPHVETGWYPPDWHLHRSEERYIGWLDRYCDRLPAGVAPRTGDISLFRFGRCFSHGAIHVDDDGLLVHAYLNRGVMLSRIDEEPLEGREVIHWSVK